MAYILSRHARPDADTILINERPNLRWLGALGAMIWVSASVALWPVFTSGGAGLFDTGHWLFGTLNEEERSWLSLVAGVPMTALFAVVFWLSLPRTPLFVLDRRQIVERGARDFMLDWDRIHRVVIADDLGSLSFIFYYLNEDSKEHGLSVMSEFHSFDARQLEDFLIEVVGEKIDDRRTRT